MLGWVFVWVLWGDRCKNSNIERLMMMESFRECFLRVFFFFLSCGGLKMIDWVKRARALSAF